MGTLRLCLLGTGKINAKHLRTIRKLDRSIELSVASREAQRAAHYRHRHKLAGHFGSYEAAIASSEVDAVIVGTPPATHAEIVDQCLALSKSAVIEKPAFNSHREFLERFGQLTQSRATYLVAENLHYAPFHRKLKGLIGNSHLGRPLYLDLTRLGRARPSGWRADPHEMPLGALHEGGVHWIRRLLDLASIFDDGEDLSSSILDVQCYGPPSPLIAVPGEDTSLVIARHRSGLTSRLLHSWAVPWRSIMADSSKLVCESGAVYFDARGVIGRYYGPDGKRMLWPSVNDAGGYRAMWRNFLGVLKGTARPALSMKELLVDFAFMDAAYRSRRSGRPERLDLSALLAATGPA